MDEVAILIPCYNEAITIKKVISDIKDQAPMAHIYVYDNNSTDDTVDIARSCEVDVRYCRKQGKGNVVRQMFLEIDAKCYVMVDGDDTYDVSNISKMIDSVLINQSDMVVGDRLSSTYFVENKRLFHNSGNMLVRKLINSMFSSDIKDVMSGYRAFSYRFVKTFPVLSRGFEIETEMTIHALDKNLNIDNIVCTYKDRPDGSISKLNTVSDGCRVLRTIMDLCRIYKPLQFFGFFAVLLFIFGTCFFIPVFVKYLDTGLVSKFPTLIVCCCAWMISVQSFFAGCILDVIHKRDLYDFEYKLSQVCSDFARYF